MKLAELQKKIAEVLGVSSSQRELAFDIFVEKISEILLEQLTLKIPRIGYFQLKANWNKEGLRPLIFAPFSEDFTKEEKNLYLTIDAAPKLKSSSELDSSIFSIGVGKPLLPLANDEMPDAETSFAMIRKSIEERVKEILTESDQIPNFNIWDDYYNSPEFYEPESPERMRSQLDELTSDLDFSSEIIPDKIPDNILEVLDFNFDNKKEFEAPKAPKTVNTENEEDYTLIGRDKFSFPKEEEEEFGDEEESAESAVNSAIIEKEDSSVEKVESEKEPEINEPAKVDQINAEVKNGIETAGRQEENSFYHELLPEDTTPPLSFDSAEISDSDSNEISNSSGEMVTDQSATEDYSAAENLEHPEESAAKLTIAQLLEDLPHQIEKKIEPESKIEDQGSSILAAEVVEKILTEDAEKKPEETSVAAENNESEIIESEFEKLHKLSLADAESAKKYFEEEDLKFEQTAIPENLGDEELNNDEIPEEQLPDEESGGMEWTWGDELREEFGISEEEVDAKYEMMSEGEPEPGNEIDFVDYYLDDERMKRDLFSKLEKTLEREIRSSEPAPLRKTGTLSRKEMTSERDSLKNVFLEFSGPPSKYEFVEDQPGAKEKRMAITLMNETAGRISDQRFTPGEKPAEKEKNKLSAKFYFITGGTALIILLLIASIFYFNKKSANNNLSQKPQNSTENFTPDKNSADNSNPQGIRNSNISSETVQDEMNDFPRTATAPVPIKDATDKQILETIKKESAKIENSKKNNKSKPEKEKKQAAENKALYKNANGETKISNRIFSDGKNYSLQISSWPSRARAEDEVKRLRGEGFNAFIVEANLPQKGGKWFRVRIGPFRSEKETNDFMKNNNF